MKVLCDVHIARKVVRFLESVGIEAVHVNDILDSSYTKDQVIARYADEHDYVILSKDADFRNSHLLKGEPQKLLKVNLGNLSTNKLISILEEHLDLFQTKFEQGKSMIEINPDSIVFIEQ